MYLFLFITCQWHFLLNFIYYCCNFVGIILFLCPNLLVSSVWRLWFARHYICFLCVCSSDLSYISIIYFIRLMHLLLKFVYYCCNFADTVLLLFLILLVSFFGRFVVYSGGILVFFAFVLLIMVIISITYFIYFLLLSLLNFVYFCWNFGGTILLPF